MVDENNESGGFRKMTWKSSRLSVAEIKDGGYLGDYQVLDILGRGPTGTTYHVMSSTLNKEFALKALVLNESLSLEWLDRLKMQTSVLSKLSHANVDRVINSGQSGKIWFVLKDFSHDGEGNSCNLFHYREKHGGRLSPHQVFHIADQVIQSLEHASSFEDGQHQGLCHGNLKPENILISHIVGMDVSFDRSGVPFEVRVSDFQPYGLMDESVIFSAYDEWQKIMEAYPLRVSEKAMGQALCGIFRSCDYQAPEMDRERIPTVQADLYSLGVLIYEMLVGQVPCGNFPLPSVVRSELYEGWDELVLRCLQSNPQKRYTTASELHEDLKKCFQEETEGVSQEESVRVSVSKKSKGRRSLTPPGMVYIPAGKFFVGSADCGEDALPQHEVSTEGFYLDRAPVTNAQYRKFVEETGYVTEAEAGKGAPIWGEGMWKVLQGISWKNPLGQGLPSNFDSHPVVQLTYADALAYTDWLGRRLPTEQEWEYAARGGQREVKYPWGNTITRNNANYSSDSTSSVMAYQANGYGLYDMAGNVWEWTSSWYEAYPGNKRPNPHFGQQYKVVRGGAWIYDGFHCMISYRNANQPDHCYPTVGFRTAYDFNASAT